MHIHPLMTSGKGGYMYVQIMILSGGWRGLVGQEEEVNMSRSRLGPFFFSLGRFSVSET